MSEVRFVIQESVSKEVQDEIYNLEAHAANFELVNGFILANCHSQFDRYKHTPWLMSPNGVIRAFDYGDYEKEIRIAEPDISLEGESTLLTVENVIKLKKNELAVKTKIYVPFLGKVGLFLNSPEQETSGEKEKESSLVMTPKQISSLLSKYMSDSVELRPVQKHNLSEMFNINGSLLKFLLNHD